MDSNVVRFKTRTPYKKADDFAYIKLTAQKKDRA